MSGLFSLEDQQGHRPSPRQAYAQTTPIIYRLFINIFEGSQTNNSDIFWILELSRMHTRKAYFYIEFKEYLKKKFLYCIIKYKVVTLMNSAMCSSKSLPSFLILAWMTGTRDDSPTWKKQFIFLAIWKNISITLSGLTTSYDGFLFNVCSLKRPS